MRHRASVAHDHQQATMRAQHAVHFAVVIGGQHLPFETSACLVHHACLFEKMFSLIAKSAQGMYRLPVLRCQAQATLHILAITRPHPREIFGVGLPAHPNPRQRQIRHEIESMFEQGRDIDGLLQQKIAQQDHRTALRIRNIRCRISNLLEKLGARGVGAYRDGVPDDQRGRAFGNAGV